MLKCLDTIISRVLEMLKPHLKKAGPPVTSKQAALSPAPKRPIDTIVIHHSATPRGRHVSVDEIREWHLERGFSDIGYHEVILIDGTIAAGRNIDTPGAHVKGRNSTSIGICLIGDGRDGFESEQWAALKSLVRYYKIMIPYAKIVGHRDLAATICPGFDVKAWHDKTFRED